MDLQRGHLHHSRLALAGGHDLAIQRLRGADGGVHGGAAGGARRKLLRRQEGALRQGAARRGDIVIGTL
jgi:hypothetical protein